MPSLHVLVIDDEPAARQVLAAAVGAAGYSVDSAADVAEAKQKLSGGDVDVALCDIQLPDGHGIDLLKQSRATGLDTAFVMVTAFASVDYANSPDYNSDVVFAVDQGRNNEELVQLYPGRKLYKLVGTTITTYVPPE